MTALTVGLGPRPGERWTRFAGRIANAFGLVLVLVVTTYALVSMMPVTGWTGVVVASSVCATATTAIVSSGLGPRAVRVSLGLSATAVALAIVAAAARDNAPLGVAALVEVVLLLTATFGVLRAVLSESEVGFRTILGAISVYVILGLLFTFLYVAVDRLQDGPFFGPTPLQNGDFAFFSITTLSTTGYGNLVPAGQPGRFFSGIEMLAGQIYLVTLIAGLVSLWRPRRMRQQST